MLLVVFSQGMNNGCGDVALRRLKWIYTRIGLSLGANSSSGSGLHPTLCYVAPTVLARTHNYALWIITSRTSNDTHVRASLREGV